MLHSHLKVIKWGLKVENDKGKIFVPTLPSGLLLDNKDKVVSIENIDESKLMGYTDAVNTLKWIYKNINYREDDVIIRCNVYPIEYILDDEEKEYYSFSNK